MKKLKDGLSLDKDTQAQFQIISHMFDKPRVRLNNLKAGLRFHYRGLNPIKDFISLSHI